MDKKTEVKRLLEKVESQKGIERAKTLKSILELVADPLTEEEWKEAETPLRPVPKRAIAVSFSHDARSIEKLTQTRREAAEKLEAAKMERAQAKKRLKELRKKLGAVRDPEWPDLKYPLPTGFVQVIAPQQHSLYEDGEVAAIRRSGIEVRKETEKAVQVYYLVNSKYRPEVFEWWPKSQIAIEDGRVVGVSEWFAKKNKLPSR